MTEDPNSTVPNIQGQDATTHVVEAHRILSGMPRREEHPDLQEAIAKLEMALSILTTKTGGML